MHKNCMPTTVVYINKKTCNFNNLKKIGQKL